MTHEWMTEGRECWVIQYPMYYRGKANEPIPAKIKRVYPDHVDVIFNNGESVDVSRIDVLPSRITAQAVMIHRIADEIRELQSVMAQLEGFFSEGK